MLINSLRSFPSVSLNLLVSLPLVIGLGGVGLGRVGSGVAGPGCCGVFVIPESCGRTNLHRSVLAL